MTAQSWEGPWGHPTGPPMSIDTFDSTRLLCFIRDRGLLPHTPSVPPKALGIIIIRKVFYNEAKSPSLKSLE